MMPDEFEDAVRVDQLLNLDVLQAMITDQPGKLNPVEEVALAAGGRLMDIAWERSFTTPWRIDACKVADEPVYSLELVEDEEGALTPQVLLNAEKLLELPLVVILRDKDGRTARLTVEPSSVS